MRGIFRLGYLSLVWALPLITFMYCLGYWCSSHDVLASWYRSLNPYFYNASSWEEELFTQTTKTAGNWWCFAGLVAAIIVSFSVWKSKLPAVAKINLSKQVLIEYSLITVSCVLISFAHNWGTLYASDEVFSALNFADVPFFQGISNYPKPNNHLLFNAINGLVFFWNENLVLTGRLLALLCYCATMCVTWHFLKHWTNPIWLKALILLALSVQFPTLGFSWQARGYEMVLLFSSLSLCSFVSYFTTRDQKALIIHGVSNVLGMLTLPSYLYWWTGLGFAAVMIQCIDQKIDTTFMKAAFISLALCLISYLPLLSFSGIESLAENKYVQAEKMTRWHFIANLNERHYFNGLFSEWFNAGKASLYIGISCLMLPIFKFKNLNKDRKFQVLTIAYYGIIIAFLAVATFMVRMPYYRNLIAHGYLVLWMPLIILTYYLKSKTWQVSLAVCLMAIASWFSFKNMDRIPNSLYYYDVKHEFEKNMQIEVTLNPTAPIYLNDEGFYWWYVLKVKYPERQFKVYPNFQQSAGAGLGQIKLDTLVHPDAGIYQPREW